MDRPLILIVDDSPTNIRVLHQALEDEYEIIFAMRGKEGLRLAKEHSPELILLDVMMPGMDGYSVCSQLKSQPQTRSIPVIFITALSQQEDEVKGLKLGAIDYITKPFNPSIVKVRVRNHLALKRSRIELERANRKLSRLASIVKATADFVGIFNLDADLVYINQGGRSMVGLSQEDDLEGYRASHFFPATVLSHLKEEVFPRIAKGETYAGEVSLLTIDGKVLPVSMVGFAVPGQEGPLAHYGVILRDISERKQAEDALKRSQEQLNSILISMQEVVYSVLPNGQVIFVNPAAEEIFGLPLQQFYQDSFLYFKVIIPEDRERVKEIFQEVFDRGSLSIEYRIRRPDGELRWLANTCRVIYGEGGEVERLDGVITDITQKKKAEASLQVQLELEKIVAIISRSFLSSSSLELHTKLEEALYHLGSFFSVDHAYIYLLPYRGGEERLLRFLGEDPIPPSPLESISWWKERLEGEEYLQIEDTSLLEPEERAYFQDRSISSVITIPIQFQQQLLGLLSFESREPSLWSLEVISTLVIICEIITNAIKKKEYEEEISQYAMELEEKSLALEAANKKMEEDIEKARHIHQRALPSSLPHLEGYSLAVHYQPAENLGGDLYNMIRVGDRLILYILDVTGHGLDGAMLSFFIKNTISSILSTLPLEDLSPGKILRELAQVYYQGGFPSDYFLCIFMGVLDLKTNLLSYTGAGFQTPPLYFTPTQGEGTLLSKGLPISSVIPLDLMDFQEDTLEIQPNTTILFTTDGLVEQIVAGQEYNKRLEKIFYASTDLPPELIKKRINQDFIAFNGSLQGGDDITFFLLKYYGRKIVLTLEIPSRLDTIQRTQERIKDFVEEKTQVHVDYLSIHELLVNAIEHGNRFDPGKEIFIEVLASPTYVQVCIEDEGEGFDWESYFQNDRLKESGERGRGLFMVQRMASHLFYNEEGNRVHLLFLQGT